MLGKQQTTRLWNCSSRRKMDGSIPIYHDLRRQFWFGSRPAQIAMRPLVPICRIVRSQSHRHSWHPPAVSQQSLACAKAVLTKEKHSKWWLGAFRYSSLRANGLSPDHHSGVYSPSLEWVGRCFPTQWLRASHQGYELQIYLHGSTSTFRKVPVLRSPT